MRGQARRLDAQPEQPGIRYPAQEGQPSQAGTRFYFDQPTGAEMHNPIYKTMFQSDSAQVGCVAVQFGASSVPDSPYQTAAGEPSMALPTLTTLTALVCRCSRLGLPRCPPSLATPPQPRLLPAGQGPPVGLEVRPGCAPAARRLP